MDADNRIGAFLRARRERVAPEDVGLPDLGRRRVPGLRREELATLAGVSVDYLVRLEQGRERHPSEQVLDALARALQLDEDATAHLQELARPAPRRRRAAGRPERVRPELLRLMEAWSHTPAFVMGRRMDVLAANRLATALHDGFARGTNLVREVFLHPSARELYPDWDTVARDTVAVLRASVGPDLDRPAPDRPGRRAVAQERGVQAALGPARRARQDARRQALRPPARRRPHAVIRVVRRGREPGAGAGRLPGRGGQPLGARAGPAGQPLGGRRYP